MATSANPANYHESQPVWDSSLYLEKTTSFKTMASEHASQLVRVPAEFAESRPET